MDEVVFHKQKSRVHLSVIHRNLHQRESEDVAVKPERFARVPANKGDVMKTGGDELGHTFLQKDQ